MNPALLIALAGGALFLLAGKSGSSVSPSHVDPDLPDVPPGPVPGPAPKSPVSDVVFAESSGLATTLQAQAMLLAMSERWSNVTLNPQGVDGIVGPHTRAALRAWQAAADMPQNGVADFNTIQNLGSNWIKFGAPLNVLPAHPEDAKAFAVLSDLRERANVPMV
jgi:hypothetical protein